MADWACRAKGLHRGTANPCPLRFGLSECGVQPLLDAIVDYARHRAIGPPVAGTNPRTGEAEQRLPHPDQPFVALVSKVQASRRRVGVHQSMPVGSRREPRWSMRGDRKVERIGLLRMRADSAHRDRRSRGGDVVAVVGLKSVGAGDTLSQPARARLC